MSIEAFRDRLATDVATINEINEVYKYEKEISSGYPIATVKFVRVAPDEDLDQDRWEREFSYRIRIWDELNEDKPQSADRIDSLADLLLAKIDSLDYDDIDGYLIRTNGGEVRIEERTDGEAFLFELEVTIKEAVNHL